MKNTNGIRKLLAGVVLGAMVIAALAWIGIQVFGHMTESSASMARKAGEPIPVRLEAVSSGEVDETVSAEGHAVESAVITLRSGIDGMALSVPFRVGDVVRKGQVLATFDVAKQQAELAYAQATGEAAQRQIAMHDEKIARLEALFERELITVEEVERARLEKTKVEDALAAASAKMAQVRLDLRNGRLVAPESGVITKRDIEPGTLTKPLSDALTLSVIQPVDIEVSISEPRAASVFPGQQARVSLYAFPGKTLEGKVTQIRPTVDTKTRLLTAVVRVPNADLAIRPGMSGVINLENPAAEVTRVPSVALLSVQDGTAMVFTVGDNLVAHLRKVRIGRIGTTFTEIREGLNAGERVVVVGQAGLKDQDKVRLGEEYAPQ